MATLNLDFDRNYSYELKVPDALLAVIRTARSDLYSGPCYRDKYGNHCSMYDDVEGLHSFDFARATKLIREWCDDHLPGALYVEPWCGIMEPTPPEESEEYYEFDYAQIKVAMLGKELAKYV